MDQHKGRSNRTQERTEAQTLIRDFRRLIAECGFAALHMSACGTSRTSRDVRLESAKGAKADIDPGRYHQSRFYEYNAL
jgi:hypothetical protein